MRSRPGRASRRRLGVNGLAVDDAHAIDAVLVCLAAASRSVWSRPVSGQTDVARLVREFFPAACLDGV